MVSLQMEKSYTTIASEIFDNLCKLPLNGTEIKVIMCIFRYTSGMSNKSCRLSASFIAEWINCDIRTTKRALKRLYTDKIVIRLNPGEKGITAELAINENYEQWRG